MLRVDVKWTTDVDLVVKTKKMTNWVGSRLATELRRKARKGLKFDGSSAPQPRDGGKPLRDSGHMIKSIKREKRGRGRRKRTVVGVSKDFHPNASISVAGILGSIGARHSDLDPLGMASRDFQQAVAAKAQEWMETKAKPGKDIFVKTGKFRKRTHK